METKEAIETAMVVAQSAAAAAAANKVYPDTIQPAAKKVGSALETVASLINTILRPVKTASLAIDVAFDALDGWIVKKFKDVPAEKIVSPPPNVSAPILMQLAFIHGDERMNELRDLYRELLASAMHSDRQGLAHPAYVEVIKQMTPADVRIVQQIRQSIPAALNLPLLYPVIELRARSKGNGGYRPLGRVWEIGENDDGIVDPTVMDNLQRLGILVMDFSKHLSDDARYTRLRAMEFAKEQAKECEKHGGVYSEGLGVIEVTAFGLNFVAACTGYP
jgi:abortive infection alpha-like protein